MPQRAPRRSPSTGAPSRPESGSRRSNRARPFSALAVILVTLLAVLALAVGAFWLARPRPDLRGPIVLISIDTLRADHLPVYGYTGVRTPAIDALAADGVIFEHAYAHSPQTLPSHTAILTGQLPFETGVRDNVGFTLRANQPTLPGILHGAGFTTAGVVSAFVLRKETGIGRGFDFFDDKLPPTAPDVPIGEVQRDGFQSLAIAERWVEKQSSPRFFLFFHIYEPHAPYTPPARFAQYAPYDGEIACSDEIVGRLLQFLKDRRLYDPAMVILLADHGEALGDHGEQEHGLFLYDETIRVPLVIKMPGGRGVGLRVANPVQHIDLVPTILDLAGVPRPAALRGRTLASLLNGGASRLAPPGFYAEAFYARNHFGWSELVALTDARYRYIRAPRPELYDLAADPRQVHNLAGERGSTAAAMRLGLERLMAGARVQAPQRVSAEDLERLQALGYVGTQSADAATPADSLPDPKDKAQALVELRRAAALAARRDYDGAIEVLRALVAADPGMNDGWQQLGVELTRAGRYPGAFAAFKRLVELEPTDANSFISIAGVLAAMRRFDEARANAEIGLAKATDERAKTSACEVLVRIAMARGDPSAARRYAAVAHAADPAFPLPEFVEGLDLHRQRRFEEALPHFQAAARQLVAGAFAIPELHFYEGDTLANLGRGAEAEEAFREELRVSPADLRTRASLAMLCRADGRAEEAAHEIDAMLRAVPTPEGYAMAAKTWSIFGERARADAVRADAARRFKGRRVPDLNPAQN